MAGAIPDQFKDLFSKAAFAHLATLMPDGSPQVTPVWCDFDGTNVRVNSAKGRVKDKNMRRDKKVALSVQDPGSSRTTSPARSWRSPRKARTRTLIHWPKNTSAKTSIRFAGRGKFV